MEMGRGVAPKSGGVADRVGEDGVKMDGWMDGRLIWLMVKDG